MLNNARPLLAVFAHTAVLYLFLILALRFVGRRLMGQLTVLDLTIIILLGSAVETAMVNGNTSLAAGLVSASTLLLTNRLLALVLLRSRKLRHLVIGDPLLLVHNGHFVEEHLRRMGLSEADMLAAIRERGHAGVEEIKFAVLELDGSINVVPVDAKVHHIPRDVRAGSASQ